MVIGVVATNKWDEVVYTKKQAEKYADTLINCTNCIDCSNFKENQIIWEIK
jgi:hypothetical protein